MIKGVVLLVNNCFIYLILYTSLREDPVDLILFTFLCRHPIARLPITSGTEVNVVINKTVSLSQTYAFSR